MDIDKCINDLENEKLEAYSIGVSRIVVLIDLYALNNDNVSYNDIEKYFENNVERFEFSQHPTYDYYIFEKTDDNNIENIGKGFNISDEYKSVCRKINHLIAEKKYWYYKS